MERLLILEDDLALGEGVRLALQGDDRPVTLCRTLAQARQALEEAGPFALLILDVNLPDGSGLSLLEEVKGRVPVILLTAKGSEYDKVVGLDAGADDYVSKPFGMMELMARVRAALRRVGEGSAPPPVYELGELMVDPGRHLVQVNGENVALTLKEFQLLCLLLEHQDAVFTRDQLLNTIWGYDFDGASRTVDVHIRTLRQKLGAAGSYIQTIRGIGYKIGGAS